MAETRQNKKRLLAHEKYSVAKWLENHIDERFYSLTEAAKLATDTLGFDVDKDDIRSAELVLQKKLVTEERQAVFNIKTDQPTGIDPHVIHALARDVESLKKWVNLICKVLEMKTPY